MYDQLLQKIAKALEADGSALQPPCSAESLAQLQTMARATLAVDIPDEYADFLAITNGLDWNGLMIYAHATSPIIGDGSYFIEGFVEANYLWRDYEPNQDYLIFGESGLSKYGLKLSVAEYQLIDRASMQPVQGVSSFAELIVSALRAVVDI